MTYSPTSQVDIEPGDRACHKHNPYLVGNVYSVADNGLEVEMLWDGDNVPDYQLSASVVLVARNNYSATKETP